MEKRFVLFLFLSMCLMLGHLSLMRWLYPPEEGQRDQAVAQQQADDQDGEPGADDDPKDSPAADRGARSQRQDEDAERERIAPDQDAESTRQPAADEPAAEHSADIPLEWVTLGSVDPAGPYRLLVTLTNRGAAIARIESSLYRDIEDRSGYLGHLAPEIDPNRAGCLVRVVGPGTPAYDAGLEPGDLITALDDAPIGEPGDLHAALSATKPGDRTGLSLQRAGREIKLEAVLRRRPLEVIRPEGAAPHSLLLSLDRLHGEELSADDEDSPAWKLRYGHWELLDADPTRAVFRMVLPSSGLEVIKRYTLAPVPAEALKDLTHPSYHVTFEIEIRNVGEGVRRVAYVLDGPNGLPDEGAWYAYKISPTWGGVGLRDVAVGWWRENGVDSELFSCPDIADDETWVHAPDSSLAYIGVDAQYFSAILLPEKEDPKSIWFTDSGPKRIGPAPQGRMKKKTNTSFRLVSQEYVLQGGGDAVVHRFTLFAGPKKPELLAHYGLSDLIVYGWFWWVAQPMLAVLHFFHDYLFGNYALAIILLTVLVRLSMFPLSRKQVQSAQKMQELQPEIKRIAEKYKKDMEKRTKAQQELFKKHNYNPLGGCLVLFVQLPIFIGLYRSLSVDVELRDAPMFWEGFGWAANLAAPDMLFRWDGIVPELVVGWLGPYFHVLPLVTVGLFLLQQKMFMPPPTDDQAKMQQKVMQYMMVFIGFMFFKVASGLCLYFIVSSLWGVAERKILPRTTKAAAPGGGGTGGKGGGKGGSDTSPPKRPLEPARSSGNGAPRKKKGKKKQRGRH